MPLRVRINTPRAGQRSLGGAEQLGGAADSLAFLELLALWKLALGSKLKRGSIDCKGSWFRLHDPSV